jgi:flagellar biosynthetic protein FliR
MIVDYLPVLAYGFILIFARIGTIIMLLPALGDNNIPGRIRLSFALAVTLVLFPLISSRFGALPTNFAAVLWALAFELGIGFGIGLSIRMVVAAIQVAGTTISNQTGLSFAMAFDPSQGAQSALLGTFMSITAITLIFVTDLHHVMISGLADSYLLFEPQQAYLLTDFSAAALMMLAGAFVVAMQISAPFLVFGLLFYFGLGILSRLMPQVQIFFIAMPAGIALGILLFMALISTMMVWYIQHFENALMQFFGG